MKKKLKYLKIGDEVQLFTKLIPVPVPYKVTLIEVWNDCNKISDLHLESPAGDKRKYSFLDGDAEIAMWAGYEAGSSLFETIVCPHCGNVMK